MRIAVWLLLVLALPGCAAVPGVESQLPAGSVGFGLVLDADAHEYEYERARRCFDRPSVESGMFQGRGLSGTTWQETEAGANRRLHKCLQLIRQATLDVKVPGDGASRADVPASEVNVR